MEKTGRLLPKAKGTWLAAPDLREPIPHSNRHFKGAFAIILLSKSLCSEVEPDIALEMVLALEKDGRIWRCREQEELRA